MTRRLSGPRANANFNQAVNAQALALLQEHGARAAAQVAQRTRASTPAGPQRVFAWNVELVCRENAGLPRPGARAAGLGPDRLLFLLPYARWLEGWAERWLGRLGETQHLEESELVAARMGVTARQLACLRFAAEGKSAKETARLLDPPIAPRTVEDHLRSAYAKLGAHSKAQAVGIAREIGLLSDHP